jgi:hypothetical protein
MADTSSRRQPDRSVTEAFSIEAETIPAPDQQQDAIHGALRLLAAWAVRAARAQTEAAADRELPADVKRRTHEPQEQDQ